MSGPIDALAEGLHSAGIGCWTEGPTPHFPGPCEARDHNAHAAALAATPSVAALLADAAIGRAVRDWAYQLRRLTENGHHRMAAMDAVVRSRSKDTDLWLAELLTAGAAIAAALGDEQ